MIALAPEHVYRLDPYIPGKTIPNLIKLASNENPFGPSPKAIERVQKTLFNNSLYPNNHRIELKEKICALQNQFSLKPQQIVLGAGSTELINLLIRTFMGPQEILLNAWPSFIMYRLSCQAFGRQELAISLTPSLDYDLEHMALAAQGPLKNRIKLVFLANPNNPTGRYIQAQSLEQFLKQIPEHIIVVLDEAYFDFINQEDYPNGLYWVQNRPRTVVLRTFSKAHGLAGFRIAYALCDPEIADLLQRLRDPFNVSQVAQEAALGALEDSEHIQKSISSNQQELTTMQTCFTELGISYTKGVGNFILAHFKNATNVYEQLLQEGLIVRPVSNYGLLNSLRITIGKPEQNKTLFTAFKILGI